MYPIYLLFALDSPFSRPVLQTLLETACTNIHHPPAALILPNPDRTALPRPYTPTPQHFNNPDSLPLVSPSLVSEATLTQLAAWHQIPILTLGNLRHPDALAVIRAYQPDLLLTACFPRLLPPEVLAIPRIGSLNLHPSLLPAYRGPEPLFWQYYYGERRTGVTLHFMDEKADTGDIVSQAEVHFPDGISLAQAETLTARAGGDLICRVLAHPDHLPRIPQPEQGASYHPRPTSDDLIIPTTWTARRAFNFFRAARDWGPFEIVDQTGQRLRVRDAIGFVESLGAADFPVSDRAEIWVQFNDGFLHVLTA